MRDDREKYIKGANSNNHKLHFPPEITKVFSVMRILSQFEGGSVLASGTAAEKLQFVLEIGEATRFRDFALKFSHRARDIQNLHRTAVATDEVILVITLPKTEMSGSAVKADPAHDPLFFQSGDESIDRCRVARYSEVRVPPDFLQGERLLSMEQDVETRTQGAGLPKPRLRALFE